MDIKKILEFITTYIAGYARDFGEILASPSKRFRRRSVLVTDARGADGPAQAWDPLGLAPELWAFVFISIFIGYTVAGFTPLKRSDEFLATAVLVAINWVALSAWAFAVTSWLLKGQSTFTETASISLQVLAVTYVVSYFVTFLSAVFSFGFPQEDLAVLAGFFYLVAQSLMLTIYFAISLRAVNNFRRWKTIVLCLLVALPPLTINAIIFFLGKVAMDYPAFAK